MATYKLLSLDVWGNDDEGYEINMAYDSGIRIEIPDDATDEQALSLIKEAAEVTHPGPYAQLSHSENDYEFYLNGAKPALFAQKVQP